MLNRIELKRGAKVITKSARVSAYQMTLLYLVIQFALSLADNYVSADDGTWVQIGDMQFQVQSLFHHAAFPTPVVVFVSVLVWLLGCVLDAGYIQYHLCENPELGVMDALNMSKQQTRGYKLDLFVLDVTFLGWSLLCVLTAGILSIWITPYIQQTDLGYFEAIKAEKGIGRMPGRSPDEDEAFHHDDRF